MRFRARRKWPTARIRFVRRPVQSTIHRNREGIRRHRGAGAATLALVWPPAASNARCPIVNLDPLLPLAAQRHLAIDRTAPAVPVPVSHIRREAGKGDRAGYAREQPARHRLGWWRCGRCCRRNLRELRDTSLRCTRYGFPARSNAQSWLRIEGSRWVPHRGGARRKSRFRARWTAADRANAWLAHRLGHGTGSGQLPLEC